MPYFGALLATAWRGSRRFFASRHAASEASVAELASMLHLPRDSDHVVMMDLPEAFSPETACLALISDSSSFVRTRFVAIASCPKEALKFKAYGAEHIICINVVEGASVYAQAQRLITSESCADKTIPQALFIPRTGSRNEAVVSPLRDIVDRLAPHSFPQNFSFKQHISPRGADVNVERAPQSSRGVCYSDELSRGVRYSDGTLAFTQFNTVILRRQYRDFRDFDEDFVVGASESGFNDGSRGKALFSSPSGIVFDKLDGSWLVADSLNHCVRSISPETSSVTTIPSSLFNKISSLPPASTGLLPPLQLSHSPFKQSVFLASRRLVARLHLPRTLSHAFEWMMTGVNLCRNSVGWHLACSLSLKQFSQMSRFFRFLEVNSISHVPLWRPHRIFSDGAGGFVVMSMGRFVALKSYLLLMMLMSRFVFTVIYFAFVVFLLGTLRPHPHGLLSMRKRSISVTSTVFPNLRPLLFQLRWRMAKAAFAYVLLCTN